MLIHPGHKLQETQSYFNVSYNSMHHKRQLTPAVTKLILFVHVFGEFAGR